MKHKQILVFLSLIFIIPINIHSQDKETGILTSIGSRGKSKLFLYPKIGVSLSINNPTFYSIAFIDKLENELIKETNKMIFGGNMSYKNILLDFNYFYNKYTSSLTEFDTTYDGFEGFISYRTSIINFLNIDPYIGVGYQYSQLSNAESILELSQPVWKVGISPSFHIPNSENNIINFLVEYKQSFNTSSAHSFNNLSYGLGYGWILDY